MGVFDTVRVPCPDCGKILEFQSKGGFAPYLCTYELAHTPNDVLSDVNRHAPERCHCGARVIVDTTNRKAYCVADHHHTPAAMTDRERLVELKQLLTTLRSDPDLFPVGLQPRIHDLLNVDVTVLKR